MCNTDPCMVNTFHFLLEFWEVLQLFFYFSTWEPGARAGTNFWALIVLHLFLLYMYELSVFFMFSAHYHH